MFTFRHFPSPFEAATCAAIRLPEAQRPSLHSDVEPAGSGHVGPTHRKHPHLVAVHAPFPQVSGAAMLRGEEMARLIVLQPTFAVFRKA